MSGVDADASPGPTLDGDNGTILDADGNIQINEVDRRHRRTSARSPAARIRSCARGYNWEYSALAAARAASRACR